jgi:hypothetical protein
LRSENRSRYRQRHPFAPGLRIGLRLALEIRARDVVEQHFVLDCEQLAAALRQMRFERGLVRKQAIETAIQPILVDLLIAELKQIAKRRATGRRSTTSQFASLNLENRLRDIETDGRDRLHLASSESWAPNSTPIDGRLWHRWRSRPQHRSETCVRPPGHGTINSDSDAVTHGKRLLHL